MLKNFIFDLDGTLINSSSEVFFCLDKSFKNLNLSYDESKLNFDIIGPPLSYMVETLRPELKNENLTQIVVDEFNRLYDSKEDDKSFLFDGIMDVLLELKKQKKKLFIATNKFDAPTYRLVKKFNLNFFDDIYTLDSIKNIKSKADMINDIVQKYKLDKKETIMIGDTLFDVKAGKDANVIAGGVLWGYGIDKTGLISTSDIVFKQPSEILKINL